MRPRGPRGARRSSTSSASRTRTVRGDSEGRVTLPAAGNEVLENLAPGSYTLAVEGVAPKGFTVTEGGRTVVELP